MLGDGKMVDQGKMIVETKTISVPTSPSKIFACPELLTASPCQVSSLYI